MPTRSRRGGSSPERSPGAARRREGHDDDAFAAEASIKHAGWTVFGRGEIAENRELTDVPHGPAYRVGKLSLGAVRDFRLADHFSIGAGGLFAVNFVPDALAPLYGGNNPTGAMGFVAAQARLID